MHRLQKFENTYARSLSLVEKLNTRHNAGSLSEILIKGFHNLFALSFDKNES